MYSMQSLTTLTTLRTALGRPVGEAQQCTYYYNLGTVVRVLRAESDGPQHA